MIHAIDLPNVLKVAEEKLDPEARPMVFTRGRADVSLLKQLLSSRGASVWTDEVCNISLYLVSCRCRVYLSLHGRNVS